MKTTKLYHFLQLAVLKPLIVGVQVEDICACLEVLYMISKIISIHFIDVYDNMKDVLLTNSTVLSSRNQADMTEAIIVAYEHYAKLLHG